MTENFMGILTYDDSPEIEFCLMVKALNKQDARQRFIAHHSLIDEAWLEHVYLNNPNNPGILDRLSDGGVDHFIDDWDDLEYTKKDIEKNVNEFFGDREDYAKIFLDYINRRRLKEQQGEYQFPDEMVAYMATQYGWYWHLTIIPLSDVERI